MQATAAVILAAGQSTRMATELPKVLHEVCGRPMLDYVVTACRDAGIPRLVIVVGYRKQQVIDSVPEQDDVTWVEQVEQKGTGHAVLCCESALRAGDFANVVVLCGDGPLIRAETIRTLLERHTSQNNSATLATAMLDNPHGYGRIVRDSAGELVGITEELDCTPEQCAIHEVNPSYYCFRTAPMLEALGQIRPDNAKGEYYITDALHILIRAGHRVQAITAVPAEDILSINDRRQLAEVNKIMQWRVHDRLFGQGVSVLDPANTLIDARAEIGQDTVVHPYTYIHGRVRVGKRCSIGPFACLRDGVVLGDDQTVGAFTELTCKNPVGKGA
jgi:bifunctional UDP-N-acetylglucosamine pyrophosphorylase/glucosamine-1-phosphate N-acetyltransferase